MTCPYLEYRSLSGANAAGGADDADGPDGSGGSGGADRSGGADDAGGPNDADAADDPRAYCTAAEKFVQAMRADVCNDRYGLDHETDCEIYRDAEGLPEVPEDGGK